MENINDFTEGSYEVNTALSREETRYTEIALDQIIDDISRKRQSICIPYHNKTTSKTEALASSSAP